MALIQEHREVQEVVREQAGWVYACARRRVRNDALAEDVAQAVFILFWQKHAKLGGEAKVTGWLYRAVGYCASNALRLKQIRQRHEKEAAMAGLAGASGGDVDWNKVSPELEWAVDGLREKDRAAVLLRFYRQMSFAEVGQSLGISEEAARKRVGRALENLRGVLAKKGVVAGVAALGVLMMENVTAAAPAGLVKAVTAAVGSGGTGSAGIIAKGAMKMMAWAKMRVAAGLVIIAALAGVATLEVMVQTKPSPENVPIPRQMVVTTAPAFTGSLEAQDLLTKAEAASAWTASATSTVKLKDRIAYLEPKAMRFQSESVVRRYRSPDGRSHLKIEQLSHKFNGGEDSGTCHFEYILAGKQHIFLFLPPGGKGQVQLNRDPESVETWRRGNLADTRVGGFLDGWAGDVEGGAQSVIELSRKGSVKLSAVAEVVDGVDCRVVESETPAGIVRIWVAPAQGYNIAKFTIGRPAASDKRGPSYQMVFDQAKFATVGGRIVVAGGHYQEKHIADPSQAEGESWDQEATAERPEVDLHPRFDEPGLFTASGIPNGASVLVVGDEGRYTWKDGKPVLKSGTSR